MLTLEQRVIWRKIAPQMSRALRESAGLSLTELAKEIGVANSTVYRWEQGSVPSGEQLDAWIEQLWAIVRGLARSETTGEFYRRLPVPYILNGNPFDVVSQIKLYDSCVLCGRAFPGGVPKNRLCRDCRAAIEPT